MSARAKPDKGRPLVFLATLALIWVAVRAVAWQMPAIPAAPEAAEPAPRQLAAAPVEAPKAGEVSRSAMLVEGLEPVPGAHEHSRFNESSVAAGHDMLWMSASHD